MNRYFGLAITIALKVAMQADAASGARVRASQTAQSSGCQLGTLRFARMNVLQITPLYSTLPMPPTAV